MDVGTADRVRPRPRPGALRSRAAGLGPMLVAYVPPCAEARFRGRRRGGAGPGPVKGAKESRSWLMRP